MVSLSCCYNNLEPKICVERKVGIIFLEKADFFRWKVWKKYKHKYLLFIYCHDFVFILYPGILSLCQNFFYHSGISSVKNITMQVTLLKTTCNLRCHNSIHTISTEVAVRKILAEWQTIEYIGSYISFHKQCFLTWTKFS